MGGGRNSTDGFRASITDLLDARPEDGADDHDDDDIEECGEDYDEDYDDDTDYDEDDDEDYDEDYDEYDNYDGEGDCEIYADEPQISPDEIKRVRLLLARAPADRAWRRRSWLVMVYAHVSKARVLRGESTGEDQSEESTSAVAAVLGLEHNGGLTGVMTCLLRLELEGVFRTVVSFL